MVCYIVPLLAADSASSGSTDGWSGLNLGTWISRMQAREYELHASGWVRGCFQSEISDQCLLGCVDDLDALWNAVRVLTQ